MVLIKSDGPDRESDSLLRWARRRTLHQNKNCIIPIVGNPGSGKSYACLRLLEKNATELGRVVDVTCMTRDAQEFMEKLNSGELKKGDIVVLEEVGVSLSSREWQSRINKTVNYVFQTFRNKNLIVLLNLPDIKMLDINVLRLIHGVIVMKGIDFENNLSKFAFKVRQHNFENHKDYWKHLRVKRNGRQVRVKRHTLKKPSEQLIKEYEERRLEFTNKLNEVVMKEINNAKEKEEIKRNKGNGRPFTDFQLKVQELWHSGIKKGKDIAKEMKTHASTLSKSMQSMNKKWPEWRDSPRKKGFSPY